MAYEVINGLQESIKAFIEAKIPELTGDFGEILFNSPDTITVPENTSILLIYLYRQERNPYLTNLPVKYKEVEGKPGKRIKILPPLAFDLHYMFCVYNKSKTIENRIIEKIMTFFKYALSLTDDSLKGCLAETGNTNIKFILENLSLEDINKLWGTFPNTPSRMALFYKVSPIYIPKEQEEEVTIITDKEISVKDKKM